MCAGTFVVGVISVYFDNGHFRANRRRDGSSRSTSLKGDRKEWISVQLRMGTGMV